MSRAARLTALAGALVLGACVSALPPPDQEPDPGPALPAGFRHCFEACGSLRARGCVAGEPGEEGDSCEAVCADVEAFKPGLFLRAAAEPDCVLNR